MSKLVSAKRCVLSATAFAIALSVGHGSAAAATGSTLVCTVSSVSSDNAAAPMRFSAWCNGNASLTYSIGYSGCQSNPTDLQKLWQSLLISAFLSGKKVNIWWDDSCGSRAINAVQILS